MVSNNHHWPYTSPKSSPLAQWGYHQWWYTNIGIAIGMRGGTRCGIFRLRRCTPPLLEPTALKSVPSTAEQDDPSHLFLPWFYWNTTWGGYHLKTWFAFSLKGVSMPWETWVQNTMSSGHGRGVEERDQLSEAHGILTWVPALGSLIFSVAAMTSIEARTRMSK